PDPADPAVLRQQADTHLQAGGPAIGQRRVTGQGAAHSVTLGRAIPAAPPWREAHPVRHGALPGPPAPSPRCKRWARARRPAGTGSAVPLPESAVLDPVAAGGHVTPGAYSAVGAVVEGPPAVRVAAGLEPLPGAVALGVADHQQQGEQACAG